MPEFSPGFLLIFGALLVPFLPPSVRRVYVILLPAAAFCWVWTLVPGEFGKFEVFRAMGGEGSGFGEMTMLRVDKLSRAFGLIFTLNAFAAFLYSYYVKRSTQHVASLIYIGSALGVVFAGDLITLYINWEIMAVASAFVILARDTAKARGAAYRYILMHILGGLILLAGIAITVSKSGSIAFDGFSFADAHIGTWLILVGVLVNAAAPPFSAWLSESYPEASVTGGLILSAYTTKTTVYTLLRGFTGPEIEGFEPWPILIAVGCIMSLYGIIFALLENDMRRILAYSIINQVGFMVCAAGIGSQEAINGAVAHAFCHIIYKSLLWMSAGAVLYRIGKSRCTDLGGLYKTMPWTLVLGTIGALAISAVPFTSGFTSKTMIVHAAESSHLFWTWLILEIASAGVFLHAGIKFPYFVFFSKDRGLRPKEAPRSMVAAMLILAFLCIFLGVFHRQVLYPLLPYEDAAAHFMPYGSSILTFLKKIATQTQLLMFSALVFFLALPLLKRTPTLVLDFDWFYRKGLPPFLKVIDRTLNGLNAAAHRTFVGRFLGWVSKFFAAAPSKLVALAMSPVWIAQGIRGEELAERRAELAHHTRLGAFPSGLTAVLAVIVLVTLFFLSKTVGE